MTHVYITPDASGFRTYVPVEDLKVLVQFVDGNYRTEDEALAKAIDLAITQGHISRWVRKVDRSAAEKLVHDHIAQRAASGAQAGQATSAATANLNVLQARDQELHKMPDPAAVVDALKEDSDLLLTEHVDRPVAIKPATKPTGITFGKP